MRSLANKTMVKSKFLFNKLIVLSLSAAALSVGLQQQATAEVVANSSNSAIAAQRPTSETKLPNLGTPETAAPGRTISLYSPGTKTCGKSY